MASKIEDANNVTHVLAALAYFKLKQQVLGGTKQFEVAARYKVTQKHLSEILHGKKYLGGKQKQYRATGTKDDPELIDNDDKKEEEKEEQEETEEMEEQAENPSSKWKQDEDDDEDDTFKEELKNLKQNLSPRSLSCKGQNPKPSEENSTPDFSPV